MLSICVLVKKKMEDSNLLFADMYRFINFM